MSARVSFPSGPIEGPGSTETDEVGARLEFIGVVRASEHGDRIEGLEYEVYEPMASRVLREAAAEGISRFGLVGLEVEHSRGFVPVGKASLRVVVQSGHRGEGIAALSWYIDTLKKDAPIWKKPVYAATQAPSRSGKSPSRPSPSAALKLIVDRSRRVEVECIALRDAVGRVLGEPVVADRDVPAVPMSSMDGYAVAFADLERVMPVRGFAKIGRPPIKHESGAASRIVTGAALPIGADTVIPIEWVEDQSEQIVIGDQRTVSEGQFVRQIASSIAAGQRVVDPGRLIHPALVAALATFGVARPAVYRHIRVAVLVTGDELRPVSSDPPLWQIRDANGPALASMFARLPWVMCESVTTVRDDRDQIISALADAVERADVVVVSGGVSVGPADHVPGAVCSIGGDVVVHGVDQKPGGPVLAATMPDGTPIFGLPGNPVSALVTAHTFVLPVLRAMAGLDAEPSPPRVPIAFADDRTIAMWWHRLIAETGDQARLIPESGSGDVAAAARSDGFVRIPPGGRGSGPWDRYHWIQ